MQTDVVTTAQPAGDNGETQTTTAKQYPIETEDGFAYEDEGDETMGIETKRYENGGITKKAKLSDGKIATCRRLKGKDQVTITRLSNGQKEKFQNALVAVSCKLDDKPLVIEDVEEMWMDDANLLMAMAAINF